MKVDNPELQLAWEFVNHTNRSVFLTGKAGTGKTSFLHRLKQKSFKRMVVLAPTGVAAINAKGVTIHSFFQLPFGPILPDGYKEEPKAFNRKFSKKKINIIRSLDLLVIDEISMVRADLLDGIDQTLRRFRNTKEVFGGVQILMIGDLQQLSPVVRDNEWQLLKPFYKNAYFFSSRAYKQSMAVTIELKHIYRQNDPRFIKILNEIRTDSLTPESADELNKRYLPNFKPADGYIALTTHNKKAELVNNSALELLKSKAHSFYATVEGKFPEHTFPNKEELILKVGAQVMFIKNDRDQEKRYFNGKIGKIISLSEDEVVVKCPDDDFNIVVTPEIWENIIYSVDSKTKAITEERIGAFMQIPLYLAWAITIHKSQGLTFEKAIIDAAGAFAHGQTYVALSRCKSMEGLVLTSKIESGQIINDISVSSFSKAADLNQPDGTILHQSKSEFQLNLISEVFNYYNFLYPLNRILDIYYKNMNSITGNLEVPLKSIKDCIVNLLKINSRFSTQLKDLCVASSEPELNTDIQNRFKKALVYYAEQTKTKIEIPFKTFGFTTDNKALEKDIDQHTDKLEELLSTKQLFFDGLKEKFNVSNFLELRAKSIFLAKEKPKKSRIKVKEGTTNTELFGRLRALRSTIAEEEDLIHYQIFTQNALYNMCELLPFTKQQLKQVNGMGKVRVEKYGEAILEVIREFCKEYAITPSKVSVSNEIPKKKITDTKRASLDLFKRGKTVFEIAKERKFTTNTIIGHLSSFISSGEVRVTDLISEEKYNALKTLIPQKTFDGLSDLKNQVDEKFSYSDLKLMLADLAMQA